LLKLYLLNEHASHGMRLDLVADLRPAVAEDVPELRARLHLLMIIAPKGSQAA
jgi:hypothetical protein